jgi:HEAT repeat protein
LEIPLRRSARLRAAIAAACLAPLPCCSSPETAPLTPAEQQDLSWIHRLDPNRGKIAERGTLFTSLDQNLRTWRKLTTSTEVGDVAQRNSIEQALTRQAYINFDTILDELEHGTDPEHKTVAAAALGFARIPAPDEPGGSQDFPALHPRAVAPLLATLESGNDQLVMNALLSLSRIGDPATPRDLLIELMITHHNEDVRANATLVLAAIVTPADDSLVGPSLFAALSDPSHKVRLHSVKALGRIGDRNAQPALLNLLKNDPMPLVQACAAMEIGFIGNLSAVPSLIDGLVNGNDLVVYECQSSLLKLTGESKRRTSAEWHVWWNESSKNPSRPAKGETK